MNEPSFPAPSLIRKLTQDDCGFLKTVFTSNFRRIVDSNTYLMANTYFNAKKENNVSGLTDAYWFDAQNTCISTYNRLPMVYSFIKLVNKHIADGTEGIELLDRDNPYYFEQLGVMARKNVCESFNQLIDFFEEVKVLSRVDDSGSNNTNKSYVSYKMEGYIRFKIIR